MKALTRIAWICILLIGQESPAWSADVGSTQPWGPNGNGTLKHQDDVRWLDLHDAKVTADAAAGVYTARFGPVLQRLDGQSFVITGYMMPVSVAMGTTHFVLTRRSTNCPFCPPNEPTEAIEVFSRQFVKQTATPITVEGKLHLIANSEQGLFYRLDSAKVW